MRDLTSTREFVLATLQPRRERERKQKQNLFVNTTAPLVSVVSGAHRSISDAIIQVCIRF